MVDIAASVAALIDRYDRQPGNGAPDMLPEDVNVPQLVDEYRQLFVDPTAMADVGNFHRANGTLFDHVPPSVAPRLFHSLTEICRDWSHSALCLPIAPCTIPLAREGGILHRSFVDLAPYPPITYISHPQWFLQIGQLIAVIRQAGEMELADQLEAMLYTERMRLIPDIQGGGVVPPTQPDMIFLSDPYAKEPSWPPLETWGDYTDRLSSAFYQSEPYIFGLLGRWCKGAIRHIQDIDPCMQREYGPHWQRAKAFAYQRLTVWAQTEFNQRIAFHKAYYAETPADVFPRALPTWMLILMHEFRHIAQYRDDELSSAPAWTLGAFQSGYQYARLLSLKLGMVSEQCGGMEIPDKGFISTHREAGAQQLLAAIKHLVERDATEFSVRLAKKILPHLDWQEIDL